VHVDYLHMICFAFVTRLITNPFLVMVTTLEYLVCGTCRGKANVDLYSA